MIDRRHLSLAFFVLDGEVLGVRVIGGAVPQNGRTHAQNLLLSLHSLHLLPLVFYLLLQDRTIARLQLLIIYILNWWDSAWRPFFEIWLKNAVLHVYLAVSRGERVILLFLFG